MPGPRPDFAVVSLPVLDLRRLPDHRSELVSQLLQGEAVRVLGAAGGGAWLRVRSLEDGYRGWARAWGLVLGEDGWLARARHRISALWTQATADTSGGPTITTLLWRGRVALEARRGGKALVLVPGGRRGWLPAAHVAPAGRREPLVPRARRLLGIPYLWGGRTVQGFDCSGLSQQLLAARGLALPRDAHQQWKACRPLRDGDRPRAGDLIFFGRPGRRLTHVGVGLGGGTFVHSMGWVRLSSANPRNRLFDKELMGWSRGWRRPRAGPRSGGPSAEKH
jgi:cell wall-associated NlpC family hydrolase